MNDNPAFSKSSLVGSAVILFLIILLCGLMGVFVLEDPSIKYSYTLAKAAIDVRDNYMEPVDFNKLMVSARYAMTGDLDRFSGYLDRQALDDFEQEMTGGYFGIGISIIPHDSGLMILNVRESSPAAQAGLLDGDIIIAKDSIRLAGMDANKALDLLRGEDNTTLTATILRPATGDTLTVNIVRERIDFQHIPYGGITSDSMIYVRLLDFDAGSSNELKNVLDSLVAHSEIHLKGIILDLRNNPGGLFGEARKIAGLFLKKGDFIVGTAGRSHWNNQSFYVEETGNYENFPLAILVNGGSASASEILSGSLRYSDHAVLIGDTTYGKGLVQGFIDLPDGDALRLTISRYYFKGNRFINAVDSSGHLVSDTGMGLVPDIYYEFTEQNPFVQRLEFSLLIVRFAHQYQEELVAADTNIASKQLWINRLRNFAKKNNFDYESETTALAENFYKESETSAIKELAAKTVDESKKQDEQLFFRYGDYIWMRLRQIAYERKYGTHRAYHDIVVPESEIISLASSVLKEKNQ